MSRPESPRGTFLLSQKPLERLRAEGAPPHHVAIVGSGRWARILCSSLAGLPHRVGSIRIVAERNREELEAWVAQKRNNGGGPGFERVEVVARLADVLSASHIGAAIVAKMASQHYEATRALLAAGKHVLVEKPFVLHPREARELVALARERGRILLVGYEYMYSRAMHHFRDAAREHLEDVRSLDLRWEEPAGIEKWGERKTRDLSANVVTDLLPHVLSQLHLILGPGDITLRGISSPDGCFRSELELEYRSIPVRIFLDKEASRSRRVIRVRSSAGSFLELDYTEEPGTLCLDGTFLPGDALAESYPRSLTSEIAYFLAATETVDMEHPNAAESTLHFVEATANANEELTRRQTELMRRFLWEDETAEVPESAMRILRHQLVDPLLRTGAIENPKDMAAIDRAAEHAYRILHRFSRDPWTTQASVLDRERIAPRDLIRLNRALGESDFVQRLIVEEGIARKYWQSVLPLIETGSIDAVLENRPQVPLRVGIYAAVSCMFYCSFCGRNPDVRYDRKDVESGNDMFDSVFSEMPRGVSTLSLGGGLEPLTNPKLDDVIRSAKRHGHQVPLVTNGYMLTPKFVARHDGLWDLDVFRISWYGVDENSYFKVTRRKGAFALVKANLIEFLRERNRRGSRVKVGMNFIVLVNSTDQVLRLLDVIKEINDAVGGRGVDFLTLREDFSVPETEGLTAEERKRLVDIFARFNERRRTECPDLKVDFGYALYPLSQGLLGRPLAMVTHEGMRPRAYPQVSVAIDILGDVYLYRDAAFLERPGAARYIIGRVTRERSLRQVVADFVESGREIPPLPDDPALMDAFDHVVTKTLWQAESDKRVGIPFDRGPIRRRWYGTSDGSSSAGPKDVNYWQTLFRT